MNRTLLRTSSFSAAVLFILGMACCDALLVPRCTFEPCVAPDAGAPDLPNYSPTIRERDFELRAAVALSNTTKFVGMHGTSALFSTYRTAEAIWQWQQLSIDLSQSEVAKRLSTQLCDNCPSPLDLDLGHNNIYISGGDYYLFMNSTKYIRRTNSQGSWQTIPNISLTSSASSPFKHPILDCLAFAIQPSRPTFYAVAVLFPDNSIWENEFDGPSPTSLLVGELNSIDGNDGYDLILFTGNSVSLVQHQKQMGITDIGMQSAIQSAINFTKNGDESAIISGFISNINNDPYADLVFSTQTKIFSASYMGLGADLRNRFENWASPLVSLSSETIHSVVALDLTADSYPELVVETDKNVYFYLNRPNL